MDNGSTFLLGGLMHLVSSFDQILDMNFIEGVHLSYNWSFCVCISLSSRKFLCGFILSFTAAEALNPDFNQKNVGM